MATTTLALESGYWSTIGHGVGAILLYAIVGLALMLAGFWAIDITTPGPLRRMVCDGNTNAVVITAAGMVSMALIVVLAIFSSAGRLTEGLIATAVYGLVGVVAQVISVRVLERVVGLDIGALLRQPGYTPQSLLVAAAHLGIGLVVAFAIL
ncbi:DUF350 domain-containing protein [Nocardia sp. CDC159]|uniref:DUF350 domain-containing protein n=1 Tax=Nocardia pulmonis TaxID=2951408 RepID=A0A9X2E406_9NOCA|nr:MULTISPECIES: DUF350 domain-containing protein [Nocardia]MCM6773819.1 DUF350 domain-containing protein [Nocardia pulmonis]MCM6786706.1 DUF350 domain-containing protein [Nocardia sp. CDC159]